MALSSNVGSYVGRTVDMLAFDDAKARGDTLLTQTLAAPGTGGALISGIEKLAQRFLLELFTDLGSLTYLPGRGCTFLGDGRRGQWRTPASVLASFSLAMLTVQRNLIDDELDTDPDDERFSAASVINVSVTTELVSLGIRLESVAGTSRTLLYPLRISNI